MGLRIEIVSPRTIEKNTEVLFQIRLTNTNTEPFLITDLSSMSHATWKHVMELVA